MVDENVKKAQQMPEGVQFAIITALPNCVNGAFWGFTTVADAQKHAEVLKSDKNIMARKLSNACLIEVNPDYLYKACSVINPDLMTPADVDKMKKCMAEANASFEKFLYTKAEKNFVGQVGIYCTNDSNAITYKSVSYPAFRVNIQNMLQYCAKWGYQVMAGNRYLPAAQAAHNLKAVFQSAMLSPTNTGVFIYIKSTLAPEQIKQLKVQYGITKPKSTKPSK